MNNLSTLLYLNIFLLILQSYAILHGQSIETVVQAGHYASISAVCYSNDGKFVATGSDDKTIKLWRSTDGKEIRTYTGSRSGISQIEFNKAGTSIMALSDNGSVIVWDVQTGQLKKELKIEDDKITCASFSPEGTFLATGSKKSHVAIWDIGTGERIKILKAQPVDLMNENQFEYAQTGTVYYSSDGNYIVSGTGNNTAILWDAKTGKEIRKFYQTNYTCSSCITEAQITPDNKYVLTAHSDSLKIYDSAKGILINESYSHGGDYNSLTVSPDGRLVAAVEYGLVEIWNIKTGKLELEIGDKSNKILSVAFSPDGKRIITGNEQRMAEIWSVSQGKKLLTLKGYLNQIDERLLSSSYMYWVALVNETKLSPDGRFIAVGRTGNNARLIDFKTGKVHKTLAGHSSMVISLNFSNDGKYLATGGLDGKVIVWDVETGKSIRTFKYPDTSLAIFSVDFNPDNHILAAADWGGYIAFWDIETGKCIRTILPHKGYACYHIKFSSNGLYIISAGLDRKLSLIEIDTGEEIKEFKGHTDLVTSINLDPSGSKIITTSWDKSIRVWDIASGLQIRKIIAHEGGAYCAKFDTTGKYIISGGDDNKVKYWDASTGAMVAELTGHKGCVGDVNITADHKYVVSGSRDGSIRIWNLAEKRELVSMAFLNDNDWFIKNPEGYFDASEGAFSSISFVKGTELFAIGQFFNEFYRPGLYSEIFASNVRLGFRQNMARSIETFPPPQVQIISPESGPPLESDMVTVLLKITNNGGGVKELKVMHNGKRQMVDDSDLRRMKKAGQSATKTFDIALVPGANDITVSAFSDGEIESEQSTLSLTYKGLQKSSDGYIMSIGINKYANEDLNLNYAKPDAQTIADLINEKGRNLFNKIYTFTLFDKNATKEEIFATFDKISKTMKKDDVFVFFYAGHGSVVDNLFYFITAENTGLYQEEKLKNAICVKELQDKLKMLPALKQVVFVDACHSGSSVDMLAMRGAVEEKALAQLSRSSGIHVMASSEAQQQAAEIKSLGHGVFTYVLMEALQGKADGAPKDSKVTVYEIKSYIDDQVPEESFRLIRHKQFPSTFSIGHDFPLVVE